MILLIQVSITSLSYEYKNNSNKINFFYQEIYSRPGTYQSR